MNPQLRSNLVDVMPSGGTLVVGNSMPVRDVDTFAAGEVIAVSA